MAGYDSLLEAERNGSAFERLDVLARKLAMEIDMCDDQRNLPQLARQYRETVRMRDEIKPEEADDISAIADGVDAVR